MKTIMCLLVLTVAPVFAQYKTYSDWLPTNEDGVEYRWVVDDLYPRACSVQFRDLYKDGISIVHASVNYRHFRQPISIAFQMPVTKKSGESAERVLLSCTFLDHVEIEHTTRR
jgi:hypothetical protein